MSGSGGDIEANRNNDNENNDDDLQKKLLELQRAKSSFCYRESIAPGLSVEMELKSILHATQSEFQKIDVVETHFGKTLITDGKTQSAQLDEFVYHESLVHPSLFKHGNPKTVFIGGGGELATAREVLKHKSLERLVMVDLDGVVVDVCMKYLPEWGGEAVRNHPKLELIIGDAYEYLVNCKETFDVIIMDISDPIEAGPGIMLYTQEFYQDIVTKRLTKDTGVFVTQAGIAESVPDPNDVACLAPIYNTLNQVFDHVVPYNTNLPSFGSDWGFVMAWNNTTTTSSSGKNNEIHEWKLGNDIDRCIESNIINGANAVKFYDGETHVAMFYTTKPFRMMIQQDNRIMTKDNPIFMF